MDTNLYFWIKALKGHATVDQVLEGDIAFLLYDQIPKGREIKHILKPIAGYGSEQVSGHHLLFSLELRQVQVPMLIAYDSLLVLFQLLLRFCI